MKVAVVEAVTEGEAVMVMDGVSEAAGEFDGSDDLLGDGMKVGVVEAVTEGDAVMVMEGVAEAAGD